MSEEEPKVLVLKTNDPGPATVRQVAWAAVEAIAVTILVCLVLGAVAMVAWNALTATTGLPEIDLREAAAAVLLLRVAIITARV